MKKYTWQHILIMDALHDKPHPFPGKWPTRIAWEVGDTRYVGKPTVWAFKWYEYCVVKNRRRRAELFLEFDQDGLVRTFNVFGLHEINSLLWGYYHPWQEKPGDRELGFLKRISYKDRIHRVYSPHEKLRTREHIEPFKLWLKKHLGEVEAHGPHEAAVL